MKKLLSTLFIAAFGISLVSAAPQGAAKQLNENLTQVLSIIKKDNGSNTAQLRKQAETYATPYFDFERMTALAVGQQWKSASDAQKKSLANEFKTLLIRTYSGTMMQYKNAVITVKDNPKASGNAFIVSTEVKTGTAKPIAMDYTVYPKGGKFLVYNISVEGASLVTVYRNQFNEIISKNGIDGLIQNIANKNKTGR